MPTPFETYISKIETDLRGGKATEHTYRGTLEIFMEAQERGIDASNDPKHIACGAPDFIVERRKVPLGYVETKDVGVDLDKIEKTDQLKRYFKALNNLILTDYLEFRWYVNGEKKRGLRVATVGADGRVRVEPDAEKNLTHFFKDFYATETPTVDSPKELANRLAAVTHFIRDRIFEVLTSGEPSIQKSFSQRYEAFKDLLLPALKEEEFADLYAQTMTYGLFAAKLSSTPLASPQNGGKEPEFTITSAYQFLFGNKFLRRLFSDVSEELDEIEIIRPYLLDIVSLLNRANFANILADFGKRTHTEDPVVHFYETFLAAYDPKLRESRGVYYTPEPVVQFIVNSADAILKSKFGRAWGLADSSVKVLDPATGTGTFLYYVIQKINEEVVTNRKQAGAWKEKSKDLLQRVFGFELLIAPYVVAHLKLGLLLKTLDAPLVGNDERLHVYLTNTLEESATRSEQLTGLGHYIAEEASDAALVKKQQDIMVVLGNPPYSVTSANTGKWIIDLVRDGYYPRDEIKEQNPKMLLDDYVKFIRFGEWRINQTGYGVLAFITNHGYLDNPTFRGMRQHLMTTFDEIYVLDLHGNSKKKEKTPDGGKDENVFDIQQGVAILLAVKHAKQKTSVNKTSEFLKNSEVCAVWHAHLWGKRAEKYATLRDSDLNDIEWAALNPDKPFYLFTPQNIDVRDEYNQGLKITDIFPVNSTGMKTHRDHFVIDFEKQPLEQRISEFRNLNISDDEIRKKHELPDTRDWKMSERRKSFSQSKNWQQKFSKCLYRPFDFRHIYYHTDVIELARPKVMSNMLAGENIGLVATRQVTSLEFGHILCSNFPIEMKTCSHDRGTDFFPLYLYTTPEETAGTLFAQNEVTRQANLAPEFIQAVEEKLKAKFKVEGLTLNVQPSTFTPEDIFHYAYAIFHSPTYRTRYAEFLKIDFPRLPITSDKKLFRKLAALGAELVALHLLKTSKVDEFVTTYPEAGDNKVEKVAFVKGKVFINATQFFGKVPVEAWEFKVGGYQVCEKWLKDRKGRVLSGEEITHYQRIVVALKETIRLMKAVDKAIVKWPLE